MDFNLDTTYGYKMIYTKVRLKNINQIICNNEYNQF